MKQFSLTSKAFTLIELLIVIVIIGILAAAMIPRLTRLQDKARYAEVDKNFNNFKTIVYSAQSNSRLAVPQITQNWYSAGVCGYPFGGWWRLYLPGLSDDHPCRVNRINALRRIEVAAELQVWELAYMEKDPRGSPYLLDENEWEFPAKPCFGYYGQAANDTLISAWPDGYAPDYYIALLMYETGDNTTIEVPPLGCPGSY